LALVRLVRAARQAGRESHQLQHNKALHPTAYSPLVPRSLSAAGELSRCVAAPALNVKQAVLWPLIFGGVKSKLVASGFRRARLGCSGAAFGLRKAKQINSDTTRRCTRPPPVWFFLQRFGSAGSWS